MNNSTPNISEFDPSIIPFQMKVITHLRKRFDYSKGVNEVMLSGSVGSSKTILAAHLCATHAIENPGSQQLIVRRALKDLKATFWRVLIDHYPDLRRWWNKSEMTIKLPNGSIIYGSSYDDGVYSRFRSYELSGAILEEGTESKEQELYDEILMRIGRLPHVKENYFLTVTNPESPSHYLYKSFIEQPTSNRSVFYSLTEDNPFLPKSYIRQLKETLDPKMARRMLRGEWIEVTKDIVYYNYDPQRNFRKDHEYRINPSYPLAQMHDFNISAGKPMSSAIGQEIDGVFHVFKIFHIDGARTSEILEEMYQSGIYNGVHNVELYGDASGKNNDSRSKMSDYDIIIDFLRSKNINVSFKVPKANPPIRRRHNTVNACCFNENKQTKLYLYKGCEWMDKGLRLTQLKEGASLLEDDSLPEQHATTALGYWIDFKINRSSAQSKTIQL
jgi:hypothetical protein